MPSKVYFVALFTDVFIRFCSFSEDSTLSVNYKLYEATRDSVLKGV